MFIWDVCVLCVLHSVFSPARPTTKTNQTLLLHPTKQTKSTKACYALGYNLAIEYLADYEKTWMLDSFRDLNARVLRRDIDWVFLEVRECLGVCIFGCVFGGRGCW